MLFIHTAHVDVDRYLARIVYSGRRSADAETLRALHRRHLFTVPFENLDIGRRPIVMDEASFVRKVVDEHRGGFCYELNGAFAALLRELGFGVTLLSAGVAREAGGWGPEFDHLALLVTDRYGLRWLADVGFGDSFVEPLRFTTGVDLADPAGVFRIDRDGEWHVMSWNDKPQYRFTLTPHPLEDFAPRCHYHQTSPESSFTQKSICSLATESGRITLSGNRLITTTNGKRDERELTDDERREVLREKFGVTLPRSGG